MGEKINRSNTKDNITATPEIKVESQKKPIEKQYIEENLAGSKENEQAASESAIANYYNPLEKRHMAGKVSCSEGVHSIREEARQEKGVAEQMLKKMNNRGKGDTAIKTMLYSSAKLFNVSRRILKREVTPKQIYEFRYAMHQFEKAEMMHVSDAVKVTKQEMDMELRRVKEEEEEEEEEINQIEITDDAEE